MIEDIEELRPELYLAALSQKFRRRIFHDRSIHIVISWAGHDVPRFGPDKSRWLNAERARIVKQSSAVERSACRDGAAPRLPRNASAATLGDTMRHIVVV